jgi:hypothetical protein
MSYLAVIDRKTSAVVATVDLHLPGLPHPLGNINEVRRLDAQERAGQRDAPPAVDWRALRLAKNDYLSYLLGRVKGKLLTPALHLRRRLSVGRV